MNLPHASLMIDPSGRRCIRYPCDGSLPMLPAVAGLHHYGYPIDNRYLLGCQITLTPPAQTRTWGNSKHTATPPAPHAEPDQLSSLPVDGVHRLAATSIHRSLAGM